MLNPKPDGSTSTTADAAAESQPDSKYKGVSHHLETGITVLEMLRWALLNAAHAAEAFVWDPMKRSIHSEAFKDNPLPTSGVPDLTNVIRCFNAAAEHSHRPGFEIGAVGLSDADRSIDMALMQLRVLLPMLQAELYFAGGRPTVSLLERSFECVAEIRRQMPLAGLAVPPPPVAPPTGPAPSGEAPPDGAERAAE